MAFWCYMLRCADSRYYTGHTDDLDRRIGQHQTGGYCEFTSTRRPVQLVWAEYFPTRLEALEAERIVGGWSRAKKEALIASDWKRVAFFAKPPSKRVSTGLDTNGGEGSTIPHPFASSPVEKPAPTTAPAQGVSTGLDTNGVGGSANPDPAGPSAAETTPSPFASSPVEKPVSSLVEKPVSSLVERPITTPSE